MQPGILIDHLFVITEKTTQKTRNRKNSEQINKIKRPTRVHIAEYSLWTCKVTMKPKVLESHVITRSITPFLGKGWSDRPECMHRMCFSPIKTCALRETSFNNYLCCGYAALGNVFSVTGQKADKCISTET